MRSYSFDIYNALNRLIPSYMNGRKLNLFLRSLVYPLQRVVDDVDDWLHGGLLDASMTSQIIRLEWYLDYKLGKYVKTSGTHFVISVGTMDSLGSYLFEESYISSHGSVAPAVYSNADGYRTNPVMYLERYPHIYSFVIQAPAFNDGKITKNAYESYIRDIVDKFKLATKTYTITY